jgi:aldehyde:ferredoxin oxidoreductase
MTNFEKWKESLTPEDIVNQRFIVLSCGACPALCKTCFKYDTTCRGNFLIWAYGKYEEEDGMKCGT